jgi:SHS2 domain-containing protein
MPYKYLSHTADIKFQAFGETLEKAFESAALALKEVISGKINVKGKITKKINVEGNDRESLLYNFLEEILFLLDAEDFLLSKVKNIKIRQNELEAELLGDNASNYGFIISA